MSEPSLWDHPDPFTIEVSATAADIDSYGHVNNGVYIRWLEQLAWAHSAAVGWPEEGCVALGRGMAVREMDLVFLAACYEGDRIVVGNWVCRSDGRLRVTRRFQLVNEEKAITVLRGEIQYVCMNLETGRPTRLPPEFLQAYAVSVKAV